MNVSALALATVSVAALGLSAPLSAQEHRELGAHEHGVGQLGIAIEDDSIAMELRAPGADIVGFEHAAESDEDRALVTAALAALEQPLTLFEMPQAAGCTLVEAHAELVLGEHDDHDDDHDHDEEDSDHDHDEAHDDHGDDAAHGDHEEHEHDKHDEDHAEGDDHDADAHEHDDDHAEAHDDHDDHDHAEGGHSEFHAEYLLTCSDIGAADRIDFAYFDAFPNAQELDIQLVSDAGASMAEVGRDDPVLTLETRN
ncbi:MAG: zinc uptake protein ZrgA [Marinibacterium profundimaris]